MKHVRKADCVNGQAGRHFLRACLPGLGAAIAWVGMKRIWRVTLSLLLVSTLVGYFLVGVGQMRLLEKGEALSFQEFARNPALVSRFSEHDAILGGRTGPASVERAYSLYVAQAREAQASVHPALLGMQGVTSAAEERIEIFRRGWHRVYEVLTPTFAQRPSRHAGFASAVWAAVCRRIGMGLTLTLLAGSVIGLTVGIDWIKRKERA